MKILGIDPGYGITGFGLIDAQRGAVPSAGLRRHHHAPQYGFSMAA